MNRIFFYKILVLIKSKNINVSSLKKNINVLCFFNDTNNDLYYGKRYL